MKHFIESRLARGTGELWDLGTRAAFLDAVGDGTLPEEAFNRWLVQDYQFVKGFTAFAALTAAKTPRPGQSVLIAGLSAIDQELDWFEEHAGSRGLDLDVDPHPVCRRYVDFLTRAGYSEPFEVLLAIFFGVEVAYTVAWGELEARGPMQNSSSAGRTPNSRATCAACSVSPKSTGIRGSRSCSTR